MAINLSVTAQLLLEKRNLTPNIILEIEGVDDYLFGAIDIEKFALYGDSGLVYGLEGLVYGGLIVDERSRDYISLSGSTNTLSQQLLQDKGSAQSITTLNLDLLDTEGLLSRLITPGEILPEIMGVKCRVYLNFLGGAHPQDSILVHRGIISKVSSSPASVQFVISSPERQKRQKLFIQGNAVLSLGVNTIVTTIPVLTTEGFFLPADSGTLKTYIQIDDEIIEYTGLTDTSFTGCIRGSLGTTAATHDSESDAQSIYRLADDCIDLALKLMLSGGDLVYATESVKQFNYYTPTDFSGGIIFFNYYDIKEKRGFVIGDKINIVNSGAGNNVSNKTILDYGKNDYGSWVVVDHVFTNEFDGPADCEFISKYNVLSDGCGMTPEDVDVDQHEDLKTRFTSNLANYVFYIKETLNGEEFLPKQVYFPSGFYSLPRKSKSSIGITVPPIADQNIVFLNETNVEKPSQLKPERSIDNSFYNSVLFKFEKDPVDDRYLRGKVNYSGDSLTRIKNIGNKPLEVISDGLREGDGTDTLIRISSRRLLERYQFAAEKISSVQVFSKAGFTVEVGDVVVFGSPELKMTDITRGDREFEPKLYEVVNKSLNIKTGRVNLDLLSTAFELDGRYGIISPASYVGTGSTTINIKVIDSFSTISPKKEKDKWRDYIGETILIHSPDWTYNEETTLVRVNPIDDYAFEVSPALPSPPLAGYIIDVPVYDTGTESSLNAKFKLIHCFMCPQVPVVSGASSTVFDVDSGDIGKFHVGSIIRVHNFDYSVDSIEVEITDITSNTITVNTSLGFTPSSSEVVDLIGFNDRGLPYRYI